MRATVRLIDKREIEGCNPDSARLCVFDAIDDQSIPGPERFTTGPPTAKAWVRVTNPQALRSMRIGQDFDMWIAPKFEK